MELYYEEDKSKQKKSKIIPILIALLFILIILSIIIVVSIIYLKGTILKISIDGIDKSDLKEIIKIQEVDNNTKVYIPIRKIASYLGYQDYSGDYKYASEDNTKCHVKNEFETSMFTFDSDILIKSRGDSDYEYLKLDEKVFESNGDLYTTIDGIKKAFNVEFIFDQEKNKMEIYTMDYLVKIYTARLGQENYSKEFTDQKAIFQNMIIIQNNGNYGVIEAETGKTILETKYELISYLPNTTDFLVKSNGKYGVMSKEKKIKLKIAYEQIKIIDNLNGLYLVKENNLYGIISTEGKTIITPEHQQIGINTNDFVENGIENQYILLNKLIPIKNNGLWGFFDIEGKQVTEFKYTDLGCTSSKIAKSYPVLVIPSYNIVIVKKDKFYNLMMTNGKEIINADVLDSVYMVRDTETGKTNFYMTYNGKTKDIEQQLSEQGM